MGADALRRATGHDHAQWREILSAHGAMDMTHTQIATYLVDEHGVDGWWAQGITVDYEQACKGRLPGQMKDGTFTSSVTRTIPGARLDALGAVADAVTAVHGDRHGENLKASQPVVRWRLADGTRIAAAAQPEKPTGTPVTLTWEKLPGQERATSAKGEMVALLESVRSR